MAPVTSRSAARRPTKSSRRRTRISTRSSPAATPRTPAALKEMKGRWKHPMAGMKWYKAVKRDFAALPEG